MLKLIAVLVISIGINATDRARNDTVDPTVSWFIKYTPFFDLTKVPQISVKCRSDFQMFLTAMDNLELWALKSEEKVFNLRLSK